MNTSLIRKFVAVICTLLCLMLVVCSCDLGGNTETDTEKNTDSQTEKETETETQTESESETEPETEAAPAYVTYKVTVVDRNNIPVVGATVQLCQGDLCLPPYPSDENGVATFEAYEAEYTVKVFANGYTSDADGYSFPENSYELTITVTEAE